MGNPNKAGAPPMPMGPIGAAGVHQGPQGMTQGHNGAANAQAFGAQLGMQRDQLGGMNPDTSPWSSLIKELLGIFSKPNVPSAPTAPPGGMPL